MKKILFRFLFGILLLCMFCVGVAIGLWYSGRLNMRRAIVGDPMQIVGLDDSETQPADGTSENVWLAEKEQEEAGVITYHGRKYRYNDGLITILVLGIDKKNGQIDAADGLDGGQSDGMFLMLLDQHKKQIRIVAINRNTMAEVDRFDVYGNYVDRITTQITVQHGFGDGRELSCERTVKAVSRLFHNIPIHGYASINITGVPVLNDAIGGVTLNPIESVPHSHPVVETGAAVTLNGKQAYTYVQWRDVNEFASADKRLARQKHYVIAYANALRRRLPEDPGIVVDLYKALQEYMVTDLSLDRVTYLSTEVKDYYFDPSQLRSLPGETVMGNKYEEYWLNDDEFKDLIIELFFEPV